jgi:hypothetical protein
VTELRPKPLGCSEADLAGITARCWRPPAVRLTLLQVAMLGGSGGAWSDEEAEASLRGVALVAGADPDAAVARAREAHAAGVEVARRSPWPPPHLVDAYETERQRLLAGPPANADVLRQRLELDAMVRPRAWLDDTAEFEERPPTPLRPRGLTGLSWDRLATGSVRSVYAAAQAHAWRFVAR